MTEPDKANISPQSNRAEVVERSVSRPERVKQIANKALDLVGLAFPDHQSAWLAGSVAPAAIFGLERLTDVSNKVVDGYNVGSLPVLGGLLSGYFATRIADNLITKHDEKKSAALESKDNSEKNNQNEKIHSGKLEIFRENITKLHGFRELVSNGFKSREATSETNEPKVTNKDYEKPLSEAEMIDRYAKLDSELGLGVVGDGWIGKFINSEKIRQRNELGEQLDKTFAKNAPEKLERTGNASGKAKNEAFKKYCADNNIVDDGSEEFYDAYKQFKQTSLNGIEEENKPAEVSAQKLADKWREIQIKKLNYLADSKRGKIMAAFSGLKHKKTPEGDFAKDENGQYIWEKMSTKQRLVTNGLISLGLVTIGAATVPLGGAASLAGAGLVVGARILRGALGKQSHVLKGEEKISRKEWQEMKRENEVRNDSGQTTERLNRWRTADISNRESSANFNKTSRNNAKKVLGSYALLAIAPIVAKDFAPDIMNGIGNLIDHNKIESARQGIANYGARSFSKYQDLLKNGNAIENARNTASQIKSASGDIYSPSLVQQHVQNLANFARNSGLHFDPNHVFSGASYIAKPGDGMFNAMHSMGISDQDALKLLANDKFRAALVKSGQFYQMNTAGGLGIARPGVDIGKTIAAAANAAAGN